MIAIQTGWLTAAAVFLASLGTVSIFTIGIISIHPYQIPLLAAALIVMAEVISNRRSIAIPMPVSAPLFVFLIAVLISLLASRFPGMTVKQATLLLIYVTLFMLVVNTCDADRKIVMLHRAVILSAIVVCIYGTYKMLIMNLPGVSTGGYLYNRPKACFEEPNEFGQFIVFTMGFIFSELMNSGKTKMFGKSIVKILAIVMMLLLVVNMSRGAWLGGITILFFVIYSYNAEKLRKISAIKIMKIFGLVTILAALSLMFASQFVSPYGKGFVGKFIMARGASLFSGNDGTFLIRLEADKIAMGAMLRQPFTGVGFGNIGTIYENDASSASGNDQPDKMISTSSNFMCDIGAETGIIGLACFILFIILVLVRGMKNIAMAKDPRIKVVRIGAMASFIGLLLDGLSIASHLLPFFWITSGILCVSANEYDGGSNEK